MKIEKLKKDHRKNIIIGAFTIILIIMGIYGFVGSRAKYRYTATFPAAKGVINYQNGDVAVLAIKLQQDDGTYKEVEDLPTGGYGLNIKDSYCVRSTDDGQETQRVKLTYETNKLIMDNITKKGTKCFLVFDKGKTLTEVLATYTVDESRNKNEFTGPFTEDTNGRIFKGPEDDYGSTTYFFAGSNPNNWVKFAGYYWRIIRFNGDGKLRLIYNGPTTDQAGESTQIGTSVFNEKYDDNAYVGYMYGTSNSDNYTATHTNTNSSTIKNILDIWYVNNIGNNAAYSSKIETNVGFCGDRKTVAGVWSGYGDLGYGTNETSYAPVSRLIESGNWRNTQIPNLKCTQTNDLYTVREASIGNKALSKPIGLITRDEVVYAGGFGRTANQKYWLYTSQQYWTISPGMYVSDNVAHVLTVFPNGCVGHTDVDVTHGVRPVVNLRSDTKLTGSGTATDPYVVV